jgi:hypothetical protein
MDGDGIIGATGGCLCGAVRYRLTVAPSDAGYCHCRMCQRSSGAPVMAFATVPVGDFQVTRGDPRRRRSSGFGERWFCGDCGSPLAMRVDHQPDTIDFTVASLDDPCAAPPGFHIWTRSHVPWFEVRDDLPRYPTFRPQTRGLDAGCKRWTTGASEVEQAQSSHSAGQTFGAASGRG